MIHPDRIFHRFFYLLLLFFNIKIDEIQNVKYLQIKQIKKGKARTYKDEMLVGIMG